MVRAIHYAIQRKRIEPQRLETQRRLNLLVRTSVASWPPAIWGLLQNVVDAACLLTGARLGVCRALVSPTGRSASWPASHAGRRALPAGQVFKVERGGVYLDLFRGHETIRLTDAELRRHPRWWGLPERHAPLRGLLAARLVNAEGATDSLIMVSDKIEGDFSEEDEALLKQLAAITSLALQHIEARTDAEQANLAKSRFLANMSHELRTPMNAILGMTELALAEELSPSVRDCLQTAKESADSLLELLNEILDFSRIEAGKLHLESTAFRLRESWTRRSSPWACGPTRRASSWSATSRADVPDRLLGDPLRLRQVLVNLVGNAIKFTPGARWRCGCEEGEKERGTGKAGREASRAPRSQSLIPQSPIPVTLHFSVSDTGIGISPEDQRRSSPLSPRPTRPPRGSSAGRAWAWPSPTASWR